MSGIPRPDPQLADRHRHRSRRPRLLCQSGRQPDRRARRRLVAPAGDHECRRTRRVHRASRRARGSRPSAVVAGERLESQEFAMPASGGIRLALVAADPSGAARGARRLRLRRRAGPAQPGDVVLGEDSRFVFEMGEDGLNVFYVLQIQQRRLGAGAARASRWCSSCPSDARGAGLLEGSSPQAKVSGRRRGDCRTVPAGRHDRPGRLHVPVRRREADDRAAAAGATDARGRGRGEGRRDAVELAAGARAADDAGQRQALHRGPRRRGATPIRCSRSRSPGCPITARGRATSRSGSRS